MRERPGLWRNRDYVGWLAGESLSMLGTSVSSFAYPVLILFATGSAAQTGVVAAASNIGSLSTLLVGGAIADRYSRRAVLIIGSVVQAAVVGSVAAAVIAGHVVLAHVAAAGLVDGAVLGMTRGAERAALRRVVPSEEFSTAMSQMWARDMGVRIAGPPLGGVLFAAARWLPFLADAVSYVGAIVGVTAIRRRLGPDHEAVAEREPLLHSVGSGLRYLGRHPYLRFVAWWAAVMNMLGSGLMLLVILLVHARGGGPSAIGVTQAVGAAGGLAGAVVSGWVIRRLAGRSLVVALGWCMAAAAFSMGLISSPWSIAPALAVVTFVAVPLNVVFDTYETQLLPDEMVGRVTTAIDLAANGLRWAAPLAIGFVVNATSAATAAVIWGGTFSVVALLVQVNRNVYVLDQPIETIAAPLTT
jgi:MFS family permease